MSIPKGSAWEAMDRYEQAAALEGKRGFDRMKFFIADSARGFERLADSFKDWKPEAAPRMRAEAARRYTTLRRKRSGAQP